MRKIKAKQVIRLIIFFFPLCILVYTSVRLFLSIDGTLMTEYEFNIRVFKTIQENHRFQAQIPNESLSKQRQHFKSDTWDDVQLPPYVDILNPLGPGEMGAGVKIYKENLTSAERVRYEAGWTKNNFNEFVSDLISVHRSLPDCRSNICKQHTAKFNGALPELSIVIIFHNEAWTPLLRSVHSIISQTPANVLKEIILVDDKSTLDHLHAPLNKYFSSIPKVKILRSSERIGLTRARLIGFNASVAPVVAFLDSHIECFPGWSESMLIRVSLNPKTVVFPVIESILEDTFQLKCTTTYTYGGFDWKNMLFNWVFISKQELEASKDSVQPYRSPIMPGGLFVISREFFNELGTYDPGLDLWGGENIELSFKTWMCGGTLELDHCSHVGHIFRKGSPIAAIGDAISRNSIRVAEVWMDDYKNYYYEMLNYKLQDPGNLTDRINLRKRLQCKSFEWYLKNVFPAKKVPHSMKYAGQIRSSAFPKCVDSNNGIENKPILYVCSEAGGNQVWYMGATAQILQSDWYLCVLGGKTVLMTSECQPAGPQWEYRQDKTLYHIPTGQCLTAAAIKDEVYLSSCSNSTWQNWTFQERRTDLNFPIY